jgi:ketosteroid isomerase-like protein
MSRDAGAGTLNDERELAALAISYAAAVDGRDGDRLAGLFVDDGELVIPKVPVDLRPVLMRKGSEVLRQIPDGLRRFTKTYHEVLNREFIIEGTTATGVVYCIAHHVTAAEGAGARAEGTGAEGTDAVWYIRYLDDYRRTAAGWRMVRRELHLEWVEQRPVTLIS